MVPDKRVPLEEEFSAALGLFDRRPTASEVLARVARIADLHAGLPDDARPITTSVLVWLVREVQSATWDDRVAVADRAERIAREICPSDFGELVGLALDIGLSQARMEGGPLVDGLRSLRSPVRKRLEQIVVKLLRHVADDCRVELIGDRRP